MDDSSDLEFDNLLKDVKSTCKKKTRSKNAHYGKLCHSCPQKRFDNQMNVRKPRCKFHEDSNCGMPEPDGRKIWDGQSARSTFSKFKTPALNKRFELLSSDDEDLIAKKSEKCFSDMRDNIEYGVPQTKLMIPDSPMPTPRLNLKFRLNDNVLQDEVNGVLEKTSQSISKVLENRDDNKLSTSSDDEDSIKKLSFKAPREKLNIISSSDDSLDDILELTNIIHCTTLKNNDSSGIKSSRKLVVQTSGKKSSLQQRKVSSPDTSDEENFNPSSILLNQRPLNEGGLDCTHVPSTPTTKYRVPGLRDGYFGSTSKKTPKISIKFLETCLDNTVITTDSDFSKENVTQDITKDYSKPVPIKLYNKADVNVFLAALSPESQMFNYDAKKFVVHFEVYKSDLTKLLFYFFNKFVFNDQLPEGMPINWKSGLTSTAGNCECSYHGGTSLRYCNINLSTKLLNSADKLRDTLIHELCHAAVHLINKEREVHGPFWRFWTKTANLAFPDLPYITRCHSYKKRVN